MAVPVEGEPFRANLTAVDAAWHLTFTADKKQQILPAANLVTWGQCAEQGRGVAIILADGGILAADSLSADKEKLTAVSEIFGTQKLPLESICGVVFRPPSDRQRRDALFERISQATGDSDRLLLDNGDELTGLLVGIENDVAKLDAEVGRVEIPADRILAVIFNPALTRRPSPESNSPRGSDKTGTGSAPREYSGSKAGHREVPVPVLSEGVRAWAGFRDGSRLLATEMLLHEASLRITADGQTWNAPADRLVFLQPLGGRAVYLSDLKPAEYHQVPFLDLPWPYHADRNVTGGWLRCGGRLFLKGLGVHSKAELVYDLTGARGQGSEAVGRGAWGVGRESPPLPSGEGQGVRGAASQVAIGKSLPTRFCADIGIDDSTAGQGSVQFHVLVDGQEKFTSKTVRGGDPPVPVSVDVTGAKRLELLVDYADHGDMLDHADWLNARIVKQAETTDEHR